MVAVSETTQPKEIKEEKDLESTKAKENVSKQENGVAPRDAEASKPLSTDGKGASDSTKTSGATDLAKKMDKMAEKIDEISTAQKTEKLKPMEPFVRTIPKVRECYTWDDFKNHHDSDEHSHAIEALTAGASLRNEIDESSFHSGMRGYNPASFRPSWGYRQRRQIKTVVDDGDESWLQYVRINSRAVILYLGRQSRGGKSLKGRPHVFQRPFRYLIHFHDKMKEALAELEEYNNSADSNFGNGQSATDVAESATGKEESEANSLGIASLFTDSDALEDMRLYVKFVEERVLPDYNRFKAQEGEMPAKIRWEDLWYLFRPGDLVYVPNLEHGVRARAPNGWAEMFQDWQGRYADDDLEPTSTAAAHYTPRKSHTDQMIWKVYRPPHKDKEGVVNGCSCSTCVRSAAESLVGLYHIDYDGQNFCAINKSLTIRKYEGEKEITQLPLYPLRYVKDLEEIMTASRNTGQKFVQHIDQARRYAFYRGWTLIKTPLGESISDKNGKVQTSPEHIESEVLVDFEEAFNMDPDWKPESLTVDEDTHDLMIAVDVDSPLQEWNDSKRTKLKSSWEDKTVTDDGIETLQTNEFVKTDHLLSKKRDAEIGELEGDELALLPRRLFAYALWERKFVQIDVRDVQFPENKDKDNAFDSLQIPPEHKTLIQSLVYTHFMKRMNENSIDSKLATQDLIRGKGKGIVILLFGVPGVGKTATAEAVAQKFEKPLFPITCGDLGFTPTSVESSLTEIFRLAHLWDCVLLLDEADVFITQRDRKDLERNALVSVFLRMLEYYNGILFLTTNRPGVLDEAVKSRVHLNLQYDFLDEQQVVAIFKNNIQRLKEIEEQASQAPGHKKLYIDEKDILEFARNHWRNHSDSIGRWNGRQIRNAFLIASSLAHFEGDKGERPEGLQKQLTSKHFLKVEETTNRYDEYRLACLGDTDSYLARDRYERDDDWAPQPRFQTGSFDQGRQQTQPPAPGHLARQGSAPWQQHHQPSTSLNAMKKPGNLGWANAPGSSMPIAQQQAQMHAAQIQTQMQTQMQQQPIQSFQAQAAMQQPQMPASQLQQSHLPQHPIQPQFATQMEFSSSGNPNIQNYQSSQGLYSSPTVGSNPLGSITYNNENTRRTRVFE